MGEIRAKIEGIKGGKEQVFMIGNKAVKVDQPFNSS